MHLFSINTYIDRETDIQKEVGETLLLRTGVKTPDPGALQGWAPDVARPTPAPENILEDLSQSWSCYHLSNISRNVL